MCALAIRDNLKINLEEAVLTIEDLQSICRMCFCRNNLQRFDELYIEDLCMVDIFSRITSTDLQEHEKLPNQLCFECLSKLSQVHMFIEQIKEHEFILKTVLESQGTILVCQPQIQESKRPPIKAEVDVEEPVIFKDEEEINNGKCVVNHPIILKHKDKTNDGKLKAESNVFDHSYVTKKNLDKVPDSVNIENNDVKDLKKNRKKASKNKKTYECDICQMRFSFQQNLKRHKSIHSGKKYTCSLCDKAFTRAASRDEHVRIHTGEKPYVCIHCGKRFNRAMSHYQHLQLHKYRLGKIEKKPPSHFRCEICNKLLLTKHSLQNHMFIHSNEKPILCSACGKGFITKAALESHMNIHTGEKPFSCDVCRKTFSSCSGLNTHKLIHTGSKPHKCNVCARSFVQASHLRTHLRTHTDERPFVCYCCGRAFAQNYNLRVHLRIHTGETPYVCTACGRGFHNSSQLKKHTKVHMTNKNIEDAECINAPANDVEDFTQDTTVIRNDVDDIKRT